MAAHTMPVHAHTRQNHNTEKGRWMQTSTPNQETMCNCYLGADGNSVCPNGVSLGVSTALQGRSHAQEYLASPKQTPTSPGLLQVLLVCCILVFCLFCLPYYFLFLCLDVLFGCFVFFERVREHAQSTRERA